MTSSARQAIACVLLIFAAVVCSRSQVAPAKTATISGKVTLKSKGLPGVVVAARYSERSPLDRSRHRATTDQDGNYRITNIPPGTYQVVPISPGLVVENSLAQKSLVIDEDDNVEDVNFSLVRGGVITGKITDADGKPVVEEQISLVPVEGPYAQTSYFPGGIVTDDRGVYRAFSLAYGKYKVFVGRGSEHMPGVMRSYPQTFYPSVTDPAKATLVEVTEGSEARDIDIVMGRQITAFKVTGKIIDGETGKPVPNANYSIHHAISEGSSESTSSRSNANGEFRFEGVIPGKYSIIVSPEQDTEVRSEPVPFEVVDHDVTGLVVKTVKGITVSGVVVLEGAEDSAAIARIGNVFVYAMPEHPETNSYRSSSGSVRPDGSFKISGLSAGVFQLGVGSFSRGGVKKLSLVRVERDGVIQPNGVNIKEGERITGLRLVFKLLTATIRGQIKVEDGVLPESGRLSVWVQQVDDGGSLPGMNNGNSSPQVDSRGRFLIEGVAAGTYEISVGFFESGRYDGSRIFKQQVTVAENSVSEVTVTIKLKP